MNIRAATDNDQRRWDEFVFASPQSSFLQSWQWGQMHQLLGNTFWRFVIEDAGTWHGAALMVKRNVALRQSWLYLPRGPILNADTAAGLAALHDTLQKTAGEEKAMFVRIDPALPGTPESKGVLTDAGWQPAENQVQPQHTLVLDLTPGEDTLLAAMHSKTRYNIRLAERKGVTVRFSSSLDDLDIFFGLSHDVRNRTKLSFHPDNYYRAMLSALAPAGMMEIAIAEHNKTPLAAHLMIYAGTAATYAHGASASRHRSLMAPYALYWHTIRRAKQKGLGRYDFFGVAPPNAGQDHPWAGITRLKTGFGGTREEYVGAYDYITQESSYELFNTARRLRSWFRS